MTHRHDHTLADRSALRTDQGIRAVKISTFGLALTALIQFVIVGVGGSVGLLADALHNAGDVFTTFGLWIAFRASRRAANRRYSYGYDRFEDLAGILIVLVIAASAALAGWESLRAIQTDHHVSAIGVSLAAALVGVIGNEAVARYKIKVGRNIDSVALEADGQHSRTDAFVSAGAVAGLIGVSVGYPSADAIAGVVITAAIVWVLIRSTVQVVGRVVDSVDPKILDRIEQAASQVEGTRDVHDVRSRWAGRSLYVELHASVDEDLPLHQAHEIGEQIRHVILHDVEGVSQVTVHLDPWGEGKHLSVYHTETAHHFEAGDEEVRHDPES